jgi:hypothetical protein
VGGAEAELLMVNAGLATSRRAIYFVTPLRGGR